MEPPPSDPRLKEIHDAILAGQKIQAIKLWRELTDSGLAEAKQAIERLTDEVRAKNPEKFSQQPPPQGCQMAAAVLLFLGIAGGLIFGLFSRR